MTVIIRAEFPKVFVAFTRAPASRRAVTMVIPAPYSEATMRAVLPS
jgi:hypothetical protein